MSNNSVGSCNAFHQSSRNVFGGFGGILLEPNTSRLSSRSLSSPDNPFSSLTFNFFATYKCNYVINLNPMINEKLFSKFTVLTSLLPPSSLTFSAPRWPRSSISSRSCLRLIPKFPDFSLFSLLSEAVDAIECALSPLSLKFQLGM